MCREVFQTIGMLKGGAKTMHGLCSCVGSRHVYLVCIFLALQCETVVRVKGVECAFVRRNDLLEIRRGARACIDLLGGCAAGCRFRMAAAAA